MNVQLGLLLRERFDFSFKLGILLLLPAADSPIHPLRSLLHFESLDVS